MDDIKKILLSKRGEVSSSLDELASVVKDILKQKNAKILELQSENEELKTNNTKKTKIKYNISITELLEIKANNRLLKKLFKKEKIIKKQKDKIIKLELENAEKNTIDTKEMTAFKLVAIELDEKEKIIKQNVLTITNLNKQVDEQNKENEKLNNIVNDLQIPNIYHHN
jgi:hypothetical protein